MSGASSDIPLPSTLHLLIVEDVMADIELIVLALEAAGITFTYDTSDTFIDCQQLLQEKSYDAVLADYRLPQFTAAQVLGLLQQSGQEIPLILVTGNLGEEASVECIKAGMTDYVLKERLFRLPIVLARALQEFELRRQKQEAFARIQRQAQREQLLNQIGRTLNSSLNPEYILQEIVKLTGVGFGVERVMIFSIAADQIHVLNEWRSSDQVVSMLNFKATLSEWSDLLDPNCEFLCRQPFHAPNYAALPPTPTRLVQIQQMQTLSVLSAPIFMRELFFGGLVLHTTTNYRTFTDDEIHFLQRIADQSAIALYNAHSYELLEKLVKERTQELEQEKLLSEAANRAKSQFLRNMSHELRTPLTSILGFSSVLLEQIYGPLNARQQKYTESISNSGEHLLALISDLLDLSRIEAGKEELTLETLLVEEICQASLSLIYEQAHSSGLQLPLIIASDVTTCVADQRRLKQILVNLLSNAIKFTVSGSVTLRVEQTAEAIKFSVIDTGIGIVQAAQARLFEPFQQLESGLNRKYEGTGLGLALSRKLAQLHGGDITLQSELGRGSCFTLHLPQEEIPHLPLERL